MPSAEEFSPSPPAPRPVQDEEAGDRRHSDTGPSRKKRIRHWTADDRKVHSVFEKERRDDFRKNLLTLAYLLPSLAECKAQTISKHMVVDESIKHITAQNERLSEALSHMQALIEERDDLLAEMNQWRNRMGLAARVSTTGSDDFARQWSRSKSVPPVAAAEAGGPAHQHRELDSLDGGEELSLDRISATLPAAGQSPSPGGGGGAGTTLLASAPIASLYNNSLTQVDSQVATAPSDRVEQYHGLHIPPGLCRSDATIHGLNLGTERPENHHLLSIQPQVSTQPHAPEVEAYILNSRSSGLEPHSLLSNFSQSSYNINNNYALPPSLGDERNLNGGMGLWEF